MAVCLQPEDMFVCDIEEQDISCPPACKKLKKSQCTPLFMNAYTMRGESIHRQTQPLDCLYKACLELFVTFNMCRGPSCHSHTFEGCCHGHFAVSWQGVSHHTPRDDQGDSQRKLGLKFQVGVISVV